MPTAAEKKLLADVQEAIDNFKKNSPSAGNLIKVMEEFQEKLQKNINAAKSLRSIFDEPLNKDDLEDLGIGPTPKR